MRSDPRSARWLPLGIGLLLSLRLAIQVALYQSGFIAFTADDFGRTVVAANWARHPAPIWHGVWLPFHAYMFGSALMLRWELLWLPRILALGTGALALLLIYLLGSSIFQSRAVGLLSMILLAINPAHIWLSAVPLTEMPAAALVLATIWGFGVYLQRGGRRHLFLATVAITLANGFRFESWFVSILFSLAIVGRLAFAISKRRAWPEDLIPLLLATAIPWLPPLGWIAGNYIITGNPLYFIQEIRAYKFQWYGEQTFYNKYLETFLKIDPYLTWLGLIAVFASLIRSWRSPSVQWYAAATLIPLGIYMFLHGGQLEPPGNYIRYLALYTFLCYPALAALLARGVAAGGGQRLRQGLLLAGLALMVATQLSAAFRYVNDPAADGLAVGQTIRELRAQQPAIAGRPVLIELSYWQYLAIHVGANDMQQIIYDRDLDLANRQSQSLLLTNPAAFAGCLRSYQVSQVIVKDPQLRQALEARLQVQPQREVNGYAFYPVDLSAMAPGMPEEACPLGIGTGY